MGNTSKALASIQHELKAPKGQYNSFGKYNYRSCEDILEAVKPLLKKYNAVLVLEDSIVNVGERWYIKATAKFETLDDDGAITATAFAREPLDKKGMDESQITGTASSYARKYALNGLFLIDDTKDADTDEYRAQTGKTTSAAVPEKPKAREEKKCQCSVCGKEVNEIWARKSKEKYGEIYCGAECMKRAMESAPIAVNEPLDLPF